VRYAVRIVPAGTTSVYDRDVWEVLKYPTVGDPYIIATYHHPSLARWCLGCFQASVEVQRMGGSVDAPPPYPTETLRSPCDTPNELVW
jgi:hypothetical protein